MKPVIPPKIISIRLRGIRMTNVPCMSEEKWRMLILKYFIMVTINVLIITKCRAPDQYQSLILCCTNKKLNNPLGFQCKSAGQIYGMEEKVTNRTNPHRITACFSDRDHRYKGFVHTDLSEQLNCSQLLSQLGIGWCTAYQVGNGNLHKKSSVMWITLFCLGDEIQPSFD